MSSTPDLAIGGLVVDFWANLRSAAAVEAWKRIRVFREAVEARGGSFKERGPEETLAEMDGCGIDVSVISGTTGLDPLYPQDNYTVHEVLGFCNTHPGRLLAAMTVEGLGSISHVCRMIEELAPNPAFALVRVIPMLLQEPINSPRLYPVYERCEALGIPVSINVGVPGPRFRAAHQDPMLLDDVLIDFPTLKIVAAHMGHPWEALLVRFMRKYGTLYLSNSAWLAKYIGPEVIQFMNSSTGVDRVVFASDAPMIDPARALSEARQLPLSDEAMAGFLGANAISVLGQRVRPALPAGR
jgi:predicted TIM-barrel fold metal-dependent hydrolase